MTRDDLAELDSLVSPLIKKGQPIAHIMEEHRDEIPCNMRTLYTCIDKGYLTARNLDMHRTVRYKKRKHYKIPVVNSKRKEGRLYEDFQNLLEENPGIRVVEKDTVEGVKRGKLLQTFLWRENNLMLAFLVESKEMANTFGVLDIQRTYCSCCWRRTGWNVCSTNPCPSWSKSNFAWPSK
jgi:hypothetical protein